MRTIILTLIISGCGLPVWSKTNVEVRGKTESEVQLEIETDARETCQPLLPNREAYLECVTEYVEALSCIAKTQTCTIKAGQSSEFTATGVN